MVRLYTQPVSQATGNTEKLFSAIKASFGKVPNALRDIGSNSPAALQAWLNLDGALKQSSLSAQEIETIKLVVSQVAACDYCLAVHALVAKGAGLNSETVFNLRHGRPSGNERLDALAGFVRHLVRTRGLVSGETIVAVKSAGFNDAQIVDILLVISSIVFTNLFNRVNDTELDFPVAA